MSKKYDLIKYGHELKQENIISKKQLNRIIEKILDKYGRE